MTTESDQQAALRIAREQEAQDEARKQPVADTVTTIVIFAVIAAAILALLK